MYTHRPGGNTIANVAGHVATSKTDGSSRTGTAVEYPTSARPKPPAAGNVATEKLAETSSENNGSPGGMSVAFANPAVSPANSVASDCSPKRVASNPSNMGTKVASSIARNSRLDKTRHSGERDKIHLDNEYRNRYICKHPPNYWNYCLNYLDPC